MDIPTTRGKNASGDVHVDINSARYKKSDIPTVPLGAGNGPSMAPLFWAD
jgi:hypothetical protein